MTRFARAKGSKASNERKEEDPTPWHVMRQQLVEQLNKNDDEKKPYFVSNTTDTDFRKPEEEKWVEFSEFKLNKPIIVRDIKSKELNKLPKSQNKKNCMNKTIENEVVIISNNEFLKKAEGDPIQINTKPHQSATKTGKSDRIERKTKQSIPKRNVLCKPIAKTSSRQSKSKTESSSIQTNKKTPVVKKKEDVSFNNNVDKNKDNRKINTESTRRELKTKKLKTLENANPEQEKPSLISLEPFNFESSHTLKSSQHFTPNIAKNDIKEKSLLVEKNKKHYKKEFQSLSNKNSYKNVQTIFANGRQIEIVKFEAFWIKKEDSIKLKELRKRLRDQKLPNDKIKTIMKLERRKAEKALSREKTNVCYHCRKFGHKFSECPEINDSSMCKSGICFKCGSTEHTHFECKVTHSQNFRYAVCFVCNEQGHIAKQCSLNPQGQYPKGGSCHLCGEVTHLRKDCPKAFEENPSSFVTVEKINNNGLEDVNKMKTNNQKQNLVKNKVVLFLKP